MSIIILDNNINCPWLKYHEAMIELSLFTGYPFHNILSFWKSPAMPTAEQGLATATKVSIEAPSKRWAHVRRRLHLRKSGSLVLAEVLTSTAQAMRWWLRICVAYGYSSWKWLCYNYHTVVDHIVTTCHYIESVWIVLVNTRINKLPIEPLHIHDVNSIHQSFPWLNWRRGCRPKIRQKRAQLLWSTWKTEGWVAMGSHS